MQSNIEQVLIEAQSRWLRPAEICEILRNYKNYCISPEPANMPQNGSLFLFDRKVLRYFRNDGHNWRKKKDGKTVKEAHERLKAGRIDVLHCYYAHGEDNENFQRRSYWLLEEELSHIALVHYREVKGNRTNFNCIKGTEEAVPYYQETEPNPISDDYQRNFSTISGVDFASLTQADKAEDSNNAGLKILDFPSLEDDLGNGTFGNQAVTFQPSFPETQPDTNGVLPEQENPILGDLFNSYFDETLEFGNQPQIQKECQGNRTNFNCINETEEVVPYYRETEPNPISDNYQENFSTISGVNFASLTQADDSNNAGLKILEFPSWEDDLGNGTSDNQAVTFQPSFPETQPDTNGVLPEQENPILGDLFNTNFDEMLEFENQPQIQKEYQGNRTNFNSIKGTKEAVPYYEETEPNPISDDYQGNFSTILGVDFASLTQADKADDRNNARLKILDFPSWEDDLGNGTSGNQAVTFQPSFPETQPDTNGVLPEQENPILGDLFNSNFDETLEFGNQPQIQKECQGNRTNFNHIEETEEAVPYYQETEPNPISGVDLASLTEADKAEDSNSAGLKILDFPSWDDYLGNGTSGNQVLTFQPSFSETQPDTNGVFPEQENPVLGDLFNSNFDETWEFGNQPQIQKASEGKWHLDQNVHAESVYGVNSRFNEQDGNWVKLLNSQEPFLPKTDKQDNGPMQSNLQVQLSDADHGYYLKSNPEINMALGGKTNSSFTIKKTGLDGPLMEEILDSFTRCINKVLEDVNESHTQSSSEVYWDIMDNSGNTNDDLLMRFKIFLSLTSAGALSTDSVIGREKSQVSSKISSLLEGDNDEWDQMLKLASEKDFSPEKVQDKLLEKLLKEKLHVWLLQKAAEDGKGPSVVDEDGQGVLHFAAALGYDWALEPTIIAGVSVNFRDVNGWTALHWAAFCGRERTVVSLVSLGAAPGALTDPSPKYPSGRTAADLASAEGHKGIAGYLAESHLSTHLSSLKLDTGEGDAAEISGAKAVQKVSERSATPVSDEDLPYGLSLKDSLAAVCNASRAYANICQVFRVESFNKKQLKEYGDDTFGMSDEQALSLLALKTNKSGQHDLPVHAAAIRIQNKFRSWKGRREFLIIRQQIVKIQAHVRGHQVRKNYKKFTWSVGIIEKIILRWRRKGSGLRGFKSEALTEGHRMQDKSSEDDYDFLNEGRKQTEQRLQKALARVKSMAQYPDARDQYRRLLNVVTDIQGSKVVGGVPSSSEETADYNDEMIDFDAFLEDDTYMPSA